MNLDPAAAQYAIFGFLQVVTILIAGFALKALWSNSISLARIENSLDHVSGRIKDHEQRLRKIESNPDMAS